MRWKSERKEKKKKSSQLRRRRRGGMDGKKKNNRALKQAGRQAGGMFFLWRPSPVVCARGREREKKTGRAAIEEKEVEDGSGPGYFQVMEVAGKLPS